MISCKHGYSGYSETTGTTAVALGFNRSSRRWLRCFFGALEAPLGVFACVESWTGAEPIVYRENSALFEHARCVSLNLSCLGEQVDEERTPMRLLFPVLHLLVLALLQSSPVHLFRTEDTQWQHCSFQWTRLRKVYWVGWEGIIYGRIYQLQKK